MVDREHNSLGATERGWEELCGRRWVLTEMADVIVMPPWKIMTVGRGSWGACPLDISTPPKDKKVMRTSQHRFPKSKSSFANEITFSDKGNLRQNDWLCRRGQNGGFNITDFSRAFATTSYCISNLTQKLRSYWSYDDDKARFLFTVASTKQTRVKDMCCDLGGSHKTLGRYPSPIW